MPCSFDIRHYQEILATALDHNYRFIQYEELDKLSQGQKACILRHDIDYIPEWCLRLAQIEEKMGIRATYFFQICARPYNLREKENYRVVHKVKEMGHAIGLHFDLSWKEGVNWEGIPVLCEKEKRLFESVTEVKPCQTISFHNPHRFVDKILDQDIPGMRHTYEKKYFSRIKYLSDSQGWYEGCVCKIFASRTYSLIQLLTHEYIWPDISTGDFISDMARLIKLQTDQLVEYMITFHPICKKNGARLIKEVMKGIKSKAEPNLSEDKVPFE
ncbi:MAG: hypothetical protein HY351_00230 [Candidatus Omnitrophica bacterium]|nr:hypothetical protein [Candidatus Omnitrophota bacterium]